MNPYLKEEDTSVGGNLLSRAVLTRGLNSFDDNMAHHANNHSSTIDESDLLDLEGLQSPEMNSYTGHYNPPPPVPPNSIATSQMANPHAMAAASIGFSTTPNSSTPSRPIHSSALGSTPPVLESTSPFDDFMMNSRGVRNSLQRQPYSPDTYTNKFLNTVNSNGSTPVGSYDSRVGSAAVPPSSFGGLNSPPSASTPSQNYAVLASSLPGDQLATTPTTAELLAERRRRRRESHNAVERRRRDNINEKIKELAELVPEPFLLGQPDASGTYTTSGVAKEDKPNKGTILSKSVDYIKHLQHIIDEQNRRELELQELVQSLQQAAGQPVTEFGYTSAELELSKLGIGPKPVAPATGTSDATAAGDISNDDKTNEYFDYNSYSNQ